MGPECPAGDRWCRQGGAEGKTVGQEKEYRSLKGLWGSGRKNAHLGETSPNGCELSKPIRRWNHSRATSPDGQLPNRALGKTMQPGMEASRLSRASDPRCVLEAYAHCASSELHPTA